MFFEHWDWVSEWYDNIYDVNGMIYISRGEQIQNTRSTTKNNCSTDGYICQYFKVQFTLIASDQSQLRFLAMGCTTSPTHIGEIPIKSSQSHDDCMGDTIL